MGREGQNIVVVVTLDSKGEEALYLKNLIRRRGHNALIMDIGMGERYLPGPTSPAKRWLWQQDVLWRKFEGARARTRRFLPPWP